MGKTLIERMEHEDEQHKKRIEAILWKEGYIATDGLQPGFNVTLHGGLTFIQFKDTKQLHDSQTRKAKVKKYQEALDKNGIYLDFYDEDPLEPYLCG